MNKSSLDLDADDSKTPSQILVLQVLMVILTITLNALLLILILIKLIKNKLYSDLIILSNTFSHLSIGSVPLLFLTIKSFDDSFPYSLPLCQFWLVVDFSSYFMSSYSILILSIHRCRQLCSTKTTENISKSRILVIFILWVLSILYWGLMLLPYSTPTYMQDCDHEYSTLEAVIFEIILMNLSPLLVVILNVFIFVQLRLKIKKSKRIGIFSNDSSSSKNIKLKHKMSSVYLSKDVKAFFLIASLTLVQIVCANFYGIIWSIRVFCTSCFSDEFWSATVWVSYLNSIFNPILIFIFNKKYNNDLVFIFKFITRPIFSFFLLFY